MLGCREWIVLGRIRVQVTKRISVRVKESKSISVRVTQNMIIRVKGQVSVKEH